MKNILVPTDFSACATNALEAAVLLAKKFDAQLHLLHVTSDLPDDWERVNAPTDQEEQQHTLNIKKQLQALQTQYDATNIELVVRGGKLVEAIKRYTEEHGISLIVIGSHGASGKNEFFIGSNTQKVVRSVHTNVLVIKDKLPDIDFDKVVFASNFNDSEEGAFLRFKAFIKHFIPEIHLVMVHTSSLFDPPYVLSKEAMEDFQKLAHPFKCETHIFRDFTIERGIRTFSDGIDARLVAVSNHNRSPLRRMLVGSNVEALINHSNLPVLSIDYSDKPKMA